MLKRLAILFFIMISVFTYNYAAISVTSPSSNDTVASAEDYASKAFQDPWDMNEQTDLGWFVWDKTSGSTSNLSPVTFSNGIFSATSTSNDPNIYIVDSGVLGTCFLGKIGTNYPIDASKYTVFAVRMKLNKAHDALLYWSKDTIYADISRSGAFSVKSGWGVYIIKIPSLGSFSVFGSKSSWSGDKKALRFDPAATKVNIDIDWIRLVEDKAALYRTVRWSGNSGNVNIYLDNDRNSGNGNLGVVASNVSGTSYSLYVGALEPGTYYVGVQNTSGGTTAYGSGAYIVNGLPTIEFTSPSPEGGDDFATTELNNAWDFNHLSDLDKYYRVTSPAVTSISVENRAGDSIGSVGVLRGTSTAVAGTVGDPVLYPLLWWGDGRGQSTPIDTDKYRILVLKMGLPGNWDLNAGSIARIIWKLVGEGDNENVSQDVIIHHKSGSKIVMDTIIADMKTLPLETGVNSPSKTGWKGMAEGFRLDPLEFPTAYKFYIQSIKLAAFERADTSFVLKWDSSDPDLPQTSSAPLTDLSYPQASTTVSLYYDNNDSGFNGTLIKSGLSHSTGQYTWNTTNMSEGTYYIYAVITDGSNTNRAYARWPIVIDHTAAPTPTISLNKSSLSFSSSSSQTFNVSNSGSGTLSWTVSDNQGWLKVSPASGTNSGTVTATVNTTGLSAGSYSGTITVSDPNSTNKTATVSVSLTVQDTGGTPVISLSRSKMTFGKAGGHTTNPQTFLVSNSGTGTLNWTVSAGSNLSVSPGSGTNSGEVTVTANLSGLSNGTHSSSISVSASGASSKTINVSLMVAGSSTVPFGQFATPENNSSGRSSIPFTGWVLDDVEVVSVKIYNGSDFVGDAVFVEGARPDVEDAYPNHPLNYRAGWGYMMLTNFLPNQGNGTYTFLARATDKEGNQVTLGTRTVTLDNNNAVKPFGAIDTPAQGGTASGSGFVNWGWALTPQPNSIATNGSTIDVWIDGVKSGNPTYNLYREDIATLFPSYANSGGAIGYFYINTTNYENGVHTIQWTAKDTGGNSDGIGSRYFTIKNLGNDEAMKDGSRARVQNYMMDGSRLKARNLKVKPADIKTANLPVDYNSPVRMRTGFDTASQLQTVYPDKDGVISIEMQALDRLEVHLLDGGKQVPMRVINTKLLPVGSTLDVAKGVFYWQAGLAYMGEFNLEFLYSVKGEWWKRPIKIKIIANN